MGKPGNKNQSNISNIYGRIPGANDISKDRYTDPAIPGVGSPYDQTSWEKLKSLPSRAYEHYIGPIDTKEERTALGNKVKGAIRDKFQSWAGNNPKTFQAINRFVGGNKPKEEEKNN